MNIDDEPQSEAEAQGERPERPGQTPARASGAEPTDATETPTQELADPSQVDTDEERDPVEVLADDFVARLRRGESPSIDEYVQRHPELGDEIRDLFPTIRAMERLKQGTERSSDGRVTLGAVRLKRLGDFRIIREIGRGGMGIVYEAEQESLRRRVAVKVLPRQALLDPKQLKRFQREARTAARLHHTNIVPIFGVGEQDGFHYYVMQYIRGVGLDQIVAYLSSGPSDETLPTEMPSEADLTDDALVRVGVALLQGRLRPRRASAASSSSDDTSSTNGDSLATPPGLTAVGPAVDAEEPEPASGPDEVTVALSQARRDVPSGPTPSGPASRLVEGSSGQTGRTPDAFGTLATVGEPGGASSESVDRPAGAATYFRSVARLACQVADALHYAHTQGVLHRDIKPANLLLDVDGHVWITDFGLAKAMRHDDVSQTGDIVGTLRYMAPEQLRGQADARSDIYSLGLTLYELLTLRPAFQDTSREGLIHRIVHEEPPAPRRVNPTIPRDLETIVLKAMNRDPDGRYQSAGELAEDLQRFLNDEPIRARRVSPLERLWRWCRRNRALAASTAVALFLLVLVAVVASIGYAKTRQANLRVEQALAGEREQRIRAEKISQLALVALDRIFDQLAPSRVTSTTQLTISDDQGQQYEVPAQPVLSREVAALLQNLLVFYDKLAEQSSDEQRLRQKAADANRRVGDIRTQLGQYEEAEQAYKNAVHIYRQLLQAEQSSPQVSLSLAVTYNQLGELYRRWRRSGDMFTAHQQALQILDGLPPTVAHSAQARYERARTYYFLAKRGLPGGLFFGPPGSPLRGRRLSRLGQGRPAGQTASSQPGDRPPQRGPTRPGFLGQGRGGRSGQGLRRPGQPGPPVPPELRERLLHYRAQAVSLLEQLVEERPDEPEYRYLLALCYRDLTGGPFGGDRQLERERFVKATKLLEELVRQYPDVPDYRFELAETYARMLDPRLHESFNAQVARQYLERALQHLAELRADFPQVPEYAAAEAHAHYRLAMLIRSAVAPLPPERRRTLLAEAERELKLAVQTQQRLVKDHPDAPAYMGWLARYRYRLADVLRELGRVDEAVTELEQTIDALAQISDQRSMPWFVYGIMSEGLRRLAECCSSLGRTAKAQEARRLAEECHKKMLELLRRHRGGRRGGPAQFLRRRFGGRAARPAGPARPPTGSSDQTPSDAARPDSAPPDDGQLDNSDNGHSPGHGSGSSRR